MSEALEIWRRYNELETAGRLAEAEALCDPSMAVRENGRPAIASPAEDRLITEATHRWYPDYRREFLGGFGAGDEAACRWRITGTPGPDAPAEARPLDVDGVSLVRVKDGRIVAAELFYESSAMGALIRLALAGGEPER